MSPNDVTSDTGAARTDSEVATVSPEDLAAVIQLGSEYWLRADGVNRQPCSELFVPEGELVLGSMHLTGRPAIESFFRQRETTNRETRRVTRHVAANQVASAAGPGRIRVRSTVLVFSGTGDPPIPSAVPSGIADFEDLCVHVSGAGWFFERKVGRTIFVGAGAPSFAR